MRTRGRLVSYLSVLALIAVLLPLGAGAEPSRLGIRVHRLPPPEIQKGKARPTFDPRTILVRFRSGTSEAEQDETLESHGMTRRGEVRRTRFVVAGIGDRSATKARDDIRTDQRVEMAQLNYLRKAFLDPDDPAFRPDQPYLRNIKMPSAWGVTKGSTSWSIAILDSGVDLDHPDLKASRLKAGYDFVNNDSSPQDDNGHGTMVAGIAAAITNNGRGIAGTAWNGGILPVKVLNADAIGTDAQISSGITWAADHGAKVINLSLGGYGVSPALEAAVNYALGKNIVVVAATGNDGTDLRTYPAAYPSVLAVNATDHSGTFAWFSNYGWWTDISAPGMNIVSTYLEAGPVESYAIGSGSSFAAPIVSGVALLTRYKNQSWTRSQVVTQLTKQAKDFGPRGIDQFHGWGWVDGYASLGGPKQAPAAVPSRDSLEPNGTLDSAKPISGTLTTPTISPEGDVDWFVKSVTSTGSVTFTVTPPSFNGTRAKALDPVLEVYGPDLQRLGSVDLGFPGDPETLTVGVSSPGSYYLMVRNYLGSQGPSPYSVAVSTSDQHVLPTFATDTRSVGSSPNSVAIADVTGDGRPDVLMNTRYGDDPENDLKLFLFEQQPDGSLADPAKFATHDSCCSMMGIGVGDVSGDGKNDVAVSTGAGVDLFIQTDGSLSDGILVPTPSAAFQTSIEDMTGDGRNDLIVNTQQEGVLLYRRTDSGFSRTDISAIDRFEDDMEIGDVTGDGLADVVGLGGPDPSLHVYAQQPGGSFATISYNAGSYVDGLEVSDVTGDGRLDAIAGGPFDLGYPVQVFPQTAGGVFDEPVRYPLDRAHAIEAADLDGDERNDVVVYFWGSNSCAVLMQDSNGTLQDYMLIPSEAEYVQPSGLALGDVNSDGLIDMAVAGQGDGLVIRRQTATGWAWFRDTRPADFSTGVSRTIDPTVTFGRSIDPTSISSATAYVKNGTTWATVGAGRLYNASTKTLTFDLSGTRTANAPYVVFVDGVKDTNGNTLGTFTFRFTTGS